MKLIKLALSFVSLSVTVRCLLCALLESGFAELSAPLSGGEPPTAAARR